MYILLIAFFISGCVPKVEVMTNLTKPVDKVCIVKNSKLRPSDFLEAVRDRLGYNKITYIIVKDELECAEAGYRYVLKYDCEYSSFQHFVLTSADLILFQDNLEVSKGSYSANGDNYSPTWYRISPIVDGLVGY